MFVFFLIFLTFYCVYFYLSYQVIILNDLEQIFSQTAEQAQQDLKQHSDLLEDLGKCYSDVLSIILLATTITFLWILLLKYNAKFIIWLSIFALPIILSICLYFSVSTYVSLQREAADFGNNTNGNTNNVSRLNKIPPHLLQPPKQQMMTTEKALQNILTAELISYLRSETLWLVVSIVTAIALVLLIVILQSLRPRVSLAVALIRQASKAVDGVKSTLVFPIFLRIISITVIVYGIFVSLMIMSAGQNNLLSRRHVWKYHAINLFSILWLVHFVSGVSQTTLAGAFASYYWAYKKPQDVPFFAVLASLYRAIRFHLGDIAFGSFLIATIRYIRIVIEFIDNRIRKKRSPDINNSATRSAACFCRIFFWLLDRFLKYIDRNAYIIMSMYGEGYLKSAKRAVELLYKNSTRALVLDYVTYFVLLVSRLLITGMAGYLTAQEMFTADLHYKWLPVVLVVVGTYFISKGLFSVYSMAVDTLFICFLIDSTNNDGSSEKPYFMSKDLRRILKRNTVVP